MPINFCEENHTYTTEDGVEIPSVTTILKAAGLIDTRFFGIGYALRGKDVHLACELYDDGLLDESTVNDEVRPFCDAWKSFIDEAKVGIADVEFTVYNEKLGYAGRLDRTCLIDDQPYILDLKTGGAASFHGPQLAAYSACLKKPHRRACVYLSKEGKWKMVEYKDPQDWAVFQAALTLWKWRQKHG